MRSFKNGTFASRHLRRSLRRPTALPHQQDPATNNVAVDVNGTEIPPEAAVNASISGGSSATDEASSSLFASDKEMEEVVEEVEATTYEGEFPLKNTARVPLFNMPSPHQLTHLSPERMLG